MHKQTRKQWKETILGDVVDAVEITAALIIIGNVIQIIANKIW